jgi:hypothetical protein
MVKEQVLKERYRKELERWGRAVRAVLDFREHILSTLPQQQPSMLCAS